jgi:ABC-type sugar transport system substrate-binding protein
MSHRFPALVLGTAALTVLSAGVAACSSNSSSGGSGNSAGSSAAGKHLELVVGTKSDDFYITMECGAEAPPISPPRSRPRS